jgi:hypothetical protein
MRCSVRRPRTIWSGSANVDPPSGLPHEALSLAFRAGGWAGFPDLICADWTPEQALTVVELLDDLRDRIWAHYDLALLDLLRQERGGPGEPRPGDHSTADDWPDEPPF